MKYLILSSFILLSICFVSTYADVCRTRPFASFERNCSDADCVPQTGLVCVNNICVCPAGSHWNNSHCVSGGGYDDNCSDNDDCNENEHLECVGGRCVCISGYYFDGQSCVPKGTIGSDCNSNDQCSGNLKCLEGVCQCDADLYWNEFEQTCRHVKNCREIKEYNPEACTGLYRIWAAGSVIEVYCDYDIGDGGWTFLSRDTIRTNVKYLTDIYRDYSQVCFRLIKKRDIYYQPYIITKQHSNRANVNISVQETDHWAYARVEYPKNQAAGRPYLFVGLLRNELINFNGAFLGYSANGHEWSRTSCDGNPNSYWALFPHVPNPSGFLPNSGGPINDNWTSKNLPHPYGKFMPERFFYFLESHWGGCGGYLQSNRWVQWGGAAVGFR